MTVTSSSFTSASPTQSRVYAVPGTLWLVRPYGSSDGSCFPNHQKRHSFPRTALTPEPDVARPPGALSVEGLKALFEQRAAKVNQLVGDCPGPAAKLYLLRSDRRRSCGCTNLALSLDRIRIIA